MNKLKLYRVDVNYIKYLYSFDNKVQYNKEQKDEYTRKRPYLGVVLQVNEFEYFVPLEHPREAHQKMKDNIYILKIHEIYNSNKKMVKQYNGKAVQWLSIFKELAINIRITCCQLMND